MKKRYLVTGGAGFIGSHLCETLLKAGNRVICVDNFYNGNLNNIRGLFNYPNFHFIEADVRSFTRMKEICNNCDYIFHLAAQIHVEKSIIRPKETLEINLTSTQNFLEICKENSNLGMTLASSAEVYGEGVHSEISPLNPQSPYAASKVAAESLCTAYYHTFGTDVRVIRNFNTFGPRQKASGYGAVISIFTRRALDNRPILIYGDGSQTRDYQYIDDAVSGYLISQSVPAGTIMNTGFGEDFTINEIAEKIIEISKSSSKIVHTDARPGEVLKLRADITKAKSLGYTPQFSLEAGLKDFIGWMSKYDMESMGYMT